MTLRLVHTADWHLGHRLGPFDRGPEHDAFLAFLLDTLEEERADALLVCGDVFDRGNPPADALHRFYSFVAEAKRRLPALDLVVIGGNHDAAPRLDAPVPLLDALGVTVVGAHDPARAVVPLTNADGDVEALACAVPFLRAMDLVGSDGPADVVARMFEQARAQLPSGAGLVALSHLHLVGARVTGDAERALFSGALPSSIFPDELAYTALGHLHFAQQIDRDGIRYSGSPIPLSMTERDYAHQVLVAELDGAALKNVRARHVPLAARIVRVPEEAAPLSDVLDRLRAIELAEGTYLEVRVKLDAPTPDVRAQVEHALEGKQVRLVRVVTEMHGTASAFSAGALRDTSPEAVLAHLYAQSYGGALPDHLGAAFRELLDQARDAATAEQSIVGDTPA